VLEFIESGISKGFIFEMLRLYGFILSILVGLIVIGYYGLFVMIHGNKYLIHYEITDKQIKHLVDKKQMKQMRPWIIIGKLLSVFSKSPTSYGALKLSESRQEMITKFNDVVKIKTYKKSQKIIIKDRFLRTNVIYTSIETYDSIAKLIIDSSKAHVKVIRK
jgi:hypothetical protein